MDYYDHAVAYLTERPEEIELAWELPHRKRGGALFSRVMWPGHFGLCGCLTQIRGQGDLAQTRSLTEAIRADERIPKSRDDICVDDLRVFAEWQRRIDAELGRTPPVWIEPEAAHAD